VNKIKLRTIALQIAKKISTPNSGLTGLLINAEHIYNCIVSGNFTPESDKEEK
jgi:hypothetical protein